MTFIPVLSFPVARKLGHCVNDFVRSADLQAETMVWIARNTPADVVLGPMDLSLESEAFGARIRFADNEVPAVTGQLVDDNANDDGDDETYYKFFCFHFSAFRGVFRPGLPDGGPNRTRCCRTLDYRIVGNFSWRPPKN